MAIMEAVRKGKDNVTNHPGIRKTKARTSMGSQTQVRKIL
jgi:hypothetical protein